MNQKSALSKDAADKLEQQAIRMGEQASNKVPPQGRLEEFIEHALNPPKGWGCLQADGSETGLCRATSVQPLKRLSTR
jgi:hypothetical protein